MPLADFYYLSALVLTTSFTGDMRLDWLATVWALGHTNYTQSVVAAALAFAGIGSSFLWYCHLFLSFHYTDVGRSGLVGVFMLGLHWFATNGAQTWAVQAAQGLDWDG